MPDSADDALTVIREALAAPHLQDDPASAALSARERLENRASVIYWALFDAGLLPEAHADRYWLDREERLWKESDIDEGVQLVTMIAPSDGDMLALSTVEEHFGPLTLLIPG